MTAVNGTFSGKLTKDSALKLTDQPNHQMSIGEVNGKQKSPDPLWNDADITYWAVTDLVDGKGTQRGYYNNVHGTNGRDWGTFEGKVTTTGGAVTVEGTWKFAGGDGQFKGITGGGKFKTVMKSETEIEATWDGNYQLASAKAGIS